MNKMILVETHIYSKNNADFKKLNNLCFLSKNLYNSALFIIRQEFFNSGHYLNYYNVNKIMHDSEQIDYKSLPSQISQQTLKLVDQNFKSFFKSIKDYSKYPNKYKGKPKLPKYLDKLFGRQVVHITKQYIKRINKNEIYIKCFDLKIKTRMADINYIKIIPINKLQIKILVGYEQSIENNNLDKNQFAAIDLGINNLTTITFNDLNKQPIIINGKPLKSINQYYNKLLAKIYSKTFRETISLKNIHSFALRLANKRNNKVNDYMHKASRLIVNHLVENNIGNLIVGYNKGWKQDTTMGKVSNQNFVQIPFCKFVLMLKYKCELSGINFITIEEGYTSKCSFIDKEPIKFHEKYLGNRTNRGLYVSKNGIKINADVNGSLNIMRKYFNENETRNLKFKNFKNLVEGLVLSPLKITV